VRSALEVSPVDRNTFELRLRTAAQQAVQLARDSVWQALPEEVAFLGDSLHGKFHGPWSAEEAVTFLWRDGKVPEWIDAYVQAEDGARTLVRLNCCGRFTGREELLYHSDKGFPPIQALGPPVPIEYLIGNKQGKFDLYWQENQAPPKEPVKLTEPACRSFVI
jgi:hypothetical protein